MIPAKKIEHHIRKLTLPPTREADERILQAALHTFDEAGSAQTTPINPHVHNWVTRTVAAIVVIAVLISLGYGASRIVRRLMLKPTEKAGLIIDFKLDKDLYADLRVGTKQDPEIVHTSSVRLFVEEGQLRGTLRADICSWPKFKWRTRVVLLDHRDRRLASTEQVNENGGVEYQGRRDWFRHCIHFALGSFDSERLEQVQRVSIQCEQVPARTEVTPNAWVASNVLPVVHGRVTRPDGRPIANAVVQIREERKEGQRSIAAPDVYTDARGFYCFDAIRWAYSVSVLVYTDRTSGDRYCFQFKKFNRTLQGTNEVNIRLEALPSGTAVLKGQALTPDGGAVTQFKVDVRKPIDWKNRSDEYLYGFGFVQFFADSQGRFAMSGLPSGTYQVALMPTINETTGRSVDIADRREYVCELTEGKTADITRATEKEPTWYGRVQFEDGTPAVLPGATTQIVEWSQGYNEGWTVAIIDEEGCFTARFSEDTLQRLKSGEVWLTVNTTKSRRVFNKIQTERFPFSLMSTDKEKAGLLTMKRPQFYYGRVVYENGRPGVPPAAPWQGAGVSIRLRCTPATSHSAGITERLDNLDKQGSFSIILTDEQHEKVQAGEYSLEIMHPSYEDERVSSPIDNFPSELLNRQRDTVKAHTLHLESMTGEHRHLMQCLDSYDLLKIFDAILRQWRAEHNGEFPVNLAQLNSAVDPEVFARIMQTIEYQRPGTTEPETELHLIAYDKNLLEKIRGTHVLFSNGDIEFLPQRELVTIDTASRLD